MKKKQNAYYTVEATFVVTICIVVLMAVMYTGLYVHDRMVVETVIARQVSDWIHMPSEERYSDEEFRDGLVDELGRKLFLFSVKGIDISDGLTSKKVQVSYSMSVSIGFLNKLWSRGDGAREETVDVPDVWSAKWKWDAEIKEGIQG